MSDDIPDLYRIKYRKNGGRKWRFGIVDRFRDEAKKVWKERKLLLVTDAIYPVAEWVNYEKDKIVNIPFGHFDPENPDEYDAYVEKEYQKAKKKSDKSDTLKDKLFSVGVADGSAFYVVVKENKKTAKIEWRGFGPDGYMDQFLGLGGTFDKDRIEPFVRRREGLMALFSGASK